MKNAGKIAALQYRKLSDEQLVYSFVQHNEPLAATTLYQRYGHLLYGVACQYFREDAKMHTEKLFLEVITKLKQYRDDTAFKTWLFGMANEYFERVTGQKTNTLFAAPLVAGWQPDEEEAAKEIEGTISRMSEEESNCVKLFYLQNKTFGNIQDITKLLPQQIKQYLQTARMQVYNHLSHTKTQSL